MKQIFVTLTLACLACNEGSMQAFAMAERQERTCPTSAALLVEIGGHNFSFPKNKIYAVEGDNSQANVENYPQKREGECQSQTGDALSLNKIGIRIVPIACDSEPDCRGKEILVQLSRVENTDAPFRSYYEPLMNKKCTPLGEGYEKALSKWHKKYGGICRMDFRNEDMDYEIQFRYAPYPPQEIVETKEIVINYIKNFEVQE